MSVTVLICPLECSLCVLRVERIVLYRPLPPLLFFANLIPFTAPDW